MKTKDGRKRQQKVITVEQHNDKETENSLKSISVEMKQNNLKLQNLDKLKTDWLRNMASKIKET